MKLYVLPVERACDASCSFCVTNFRENFGALLDISKMEECLDGRDFEKIEITGGGEPTLHRDIGEIIDVLSKKAKTHMYTHGANLRRVGELDKLDHLCVSVAHYSPGENRRVMGVNPDLDFLEGLRKEGMRVKFSLLLHKSGISGKGEFLHYLDWAGNYADMVVARQIFEHDYRGGLDGEFVSSEDLFRGLGIKDYKMTEQGNPIFNMNGLRVELEYRACACEMDNPVLHADGRLYRGWSEELL